MRRPISSLTKRAPARIKAPWRALRLAVLRRALPRPRAAIFIAGQPRCGSYLLCRSLALTGLLGNGREYFHPLSGQGEIVTKTKLETNCLTALRRGMTPNGVLVVKVFWDHFADLPPAVDLDYWFPSRHWVCVRRRDELGQAISSAIALQTGQWNSTMEARVTPVYSRASVEERLRFNTIGYDQWDRYFAAQRIEPLTLWYEDFETDMHSAVASVARLAGGNALEMEVRRSQPFVDGRFDTGREKQRTTLNDEWRARFESGN